MSASRHTLPTNISKSKKVEIKESLSFILFRHSRRKCASVKGAGKRSSGALLLLEVAISLEEVPAIVFGVKFGLGKGIVLAYYGELSNGLSAFPSSFFPLLKRALDCSCIEKTAAASFIILV